MADKPWKAEEREVARKMGGRRTPLSGGRSGHLTSSDVLVDKYYVEVKLYKKLMVNTLFQDTKAKAKKEGRIPIVVMRTKGQRDRIAVIDFEWLIQLLGIGQDDKA